MKTCKCGSKDFHKVGKVKVIEHGDFVTGKWGTTFTELLWDEYELYSYICGGCGAFFDADGEPQSKTIFHHPV